MIRIVMSRIVVIFIALFCCADCMMADSFFIESGIKYKFVDDEHVNVAVQDDSLYSSLALKDYVLEIPAVVRHEGRNYHVKAIEKYAFTACCAMKHLKIGEGIEAISDYAFQACANLESVSIPSSIKVVGAAPFAGCISLQKISVDSDNETFDSRNNCNAVIDTQQDKLVAGCKGTVIVDGIKSIASRAFYKSGVTSVHIPSSVDIIESAAFKDCEYCMSISVEESNKTYKSAGSNSVVEKATNELVLGCATTKILPEVKVVGADAYMNTPSVVILPEGIVLIKEGAFSECKTLHTVILPASLKKIEERAFSGCKDLAHVVLKNKNTEIQKYAFPSDKKF